MANKIELTKQDFIESMKSCETRQETADKLHISLSTCKRRLKEFGLSTFKRVFDASEFLKLYNEGKTDVEIAKLLNCSNGTISIYRNSLNLSPNFRYNRDKLIEKCKELSKTKTVAEISDLLSLDSDIVSYFLNEPECPKNENELTEDEFQIIIGTLLGDGSISLNKSNNLGTLRFTHSNKQKNYCIWKTQKLKRLMYFERSFKENSRLDSRTNNVYKSHCAISKQTVYFKDIHDRWYSNINGKNIKHINKTDLYKLNELGLAVWFMDDGCHEDSGYLIATMCFSDEDLQIIKNFFKDKWNIDIAIRSNKEIYISSKFRSKFKSLISPYIHSDCVYKLIN